MVYQDAKPGFCIFSVQQDGGYVGALERSLEMRYPYSSAVCQRPQNSFWINDQEVAVNEFRVLHPSAQVGEIRLELTAPGLLWRVQGKENGIAVEESIYTRTNCDK